VSPVEWKGKEARPALDIGFRGPTPAGSLPVRFYDTTEVKPFALAVAS